MQNKIQLRAYKSLVRVFNSGERRGRGPVFLKIRLGDSDPGGGDGEGEGEIYLVGYMHTNLPSIIVYNLLFELQDCHYPRVDKCGLGRTPPRYLQGSLGKGDRQEVSKLEQEAIGCPHALGQDSYRFDRWPLSSRVGK